MARAEDDAKGRHSKLPFFAAFTGNSIIAAAKFVAAAFTGSSAMIAEGVHSVVDAVNNLLMLLGIHRSRAGATRAHPFGHGKELYFWSLIVAIVIFGIGGGISIYEGILHLIEPAPISDPTWSYVVLAISFVADGVTLILAYRELRRSDEHRSLWRSVRAGKDPTKFMVVLEDGAATLGVLVAAGGVALTHVTRIPYFDGAASIVIGLLLCAVALVLAMESKGLLLGESAAPEVVEELRGIVCSDPDVVDVRNVLTMHLGPYELLLNLDVQFRAGLRGETIGAAVRRIERAVRARRPEVSRIFLEARNLDDAEMA